MSLRLFLIQLTLLFTITAVIDIVYSLINIDISFVFTVDVFVVITAAAVVFVSLLLLLPSLLQLRQLLLLLLFLELLCY